MALNPQTLTAPTIFTSNVTIQGALAVNPGAIQPSALAPGTAGNYIPAESVRAQIRKMYTQASTAAAAAETRVVYRCYGALGNILSFVAGIIAPPVAPATVTVDLRKNGTTVLSSVLTINNTFTARLAQPAVLAFSTFAAGDLFEVVITPNASSGTLPNGVFAELVVDEDPQ